MTISIRRRIGATLSALACATAFSMAAPQTAHAAVAYNPGLIAFGTGYSPDWTVAVYRGRRSNRPRTSTAVRSRSARPLTQRLARKQSGQSPSTAMKKDPRSAISRRDSAARHR